MPYCLLSTLCCLLFLLLTILGILYCINFTSALHLIELDLGTVEPGPKVEATKGGVWPKPQQHTTSHDYYLLKPNDFKFVATLQDCDLLQDAFKRYYIIINSTVIIQDNLKETDSNNFSYLKILNVAVAQPCHKKVNQLPTVMMDENYNLTINTERHNNYLKAETIWGALRGLETFSQLLFATQADVIQINCTEINDFPRYRHRGLLVDTSRHFIPVSKILKILEAMSFNKMNVFHWHITDDQSFPFFSSKYPELSAKGAYTKSKVYSSLDIQNVINYSAARGIRVMPEFDTPGHTRSWGVAMPQILTPCYKNHVPIGTYGPIDPTKEFVYSFLNEFFKEVVTVFSEQYVHLGGDETGYECWESNPDVIQFMQQKNWTKFSKLEEYYIQRLVNITDNLKAKSVVWEEVFSNGVQLPKLTIVHVWKSNWQNVIRKVTEAGYNVLLSSCWYLNHLTSDWHTYYNCEPTDFKGSEEQKKLILGGEACMWSELVNEYNIESRIWPRASAVAEKLWSEQNADNLADAAKRLEEHTCRMNRRGIGAQPPTGPGFCP